MGASLIFFFFSKILLVVLLHWAYLEIIVGSMNILNFCFTISITNTKHSGAQDYLYKKKIINMCFSCSIKM